MFRRGLPLPAVMTLLACACGPRGMVVPSHRVYAPDGATVSVDGPLTFGVVGASRDLHAPWSGDPVVDDVRAQRPDFLVLTGDYVARSTPDEWTALHERWDPLLTGAVAVPGAGERRRDRHLEGHTAVFAGQGVPELRGVPFWHFDVESAGHRWRFVMVDADERALGERWRDELFWLPKVVTGDGYDHLVVILNRPLDDLTGRGEDAHGVQTLLRVVADHADPASLVAVLSGGAAANSAVLPSGEYGELYVLAGNSSVPGEDLRRSGRSIDGTTSLRVEPTFAAALDAELDRWIDAGVRDVDAGELGETWPGDVLPIRGWWTIRLQGGDILLTFRMGCHDGTHHPLYRIRFTRARGWVSEAVYP